MAVKSHEKTAPAPHPALTRALLLSIVISRVRVSWAYLSAPPTTTHNGLKLGGERIYRHSALELPSYCDLPGVNQPAEVRVSKVEALLFS